MKNETCERFLANPADDPDHLERCESCQRAMESLEDLDQQLADAARIDARPVRSRLTLPLAPWEGAMHKPWTLVGAIAVAVIGIAVMLFSAAGVSPIAGFLSALQGSIDPRLGLLNAGVSFSKVLARAPMQFHAAVAVSFVAVNFILYRLLRRPTRGLDATR